MTFSPQPLQEAVVGVLCMCRTRTRYCCAEAREVEVCEKQSWSVESTERNGVMANRVYLVTRLFCHRRDHPHSGPQRRTPHPRASSTLLLVALLPHRWLRSDRAHNESLSPSGHVGRDPPQRRRAQEGRFGCERRRQDPGVGPLRLGHAAVAFRRPRVQPSSCLFLAPPLRVGMVILRR